MEMELPNISDGEDKSSSLGNRIRKNYRHLRKWAKRTSTNCFRIYDWDIPYFPFAIDYYAGRFLIHYYSKTDDQEAPLDEAALEVETLIMKIFSVSKEQIFWKIRAKTKVTRQYEKLDQRKDFFVAEEYGVKFYINLVDYLDTGLFLDHRETRQRVAKLAIGKKVLNLFAYTCAFSVHAAMAGAKATKSVDLSNTYLDWGRDNFLLNGIDLKNHHFEREDCLKFLQKEKEKYDLIILDPPTVSRSKKMDQLFEVQKDYIFLIQKCLGLLSPEGILFFSTNSRRFKLDENEFPQAKIREISDKTVPIDFHDKKIHRSWTFANIM